MTMRYHEMKSLELPTSQTTMTDLAPAAALAGNDDGRPRLPTTYHGGKGGEGVYQTLINLMPPHRRYIELFLGAGSVLRNKRPAGSSIGVELDANVMAMWRGDEVPGLALLKANAVDYLFEMNGRVRGFEANDLIYADPPYLMDTRSHKGKLYRHEFAMWKEHKVLLQELKLCRCMVMISGYPDSRYDKMLQGWRKVTFTTTKQRGAIATECVWLNFPAPLELHDYRYLGENFRERQRIKRKSQRWKAKLLGMPDQERHAIMAAIQEMKGATLDLPSS